MQAWYDQTFPETQREAALTSVYGLVQYWIGKTDEILDTAIQSSGSLDAAALRSLKLGLSSFGFAFNGAFALLDELKDPDYAERESAWVAVRVGLRAAVSSLGFVGGSVIIGGQQRLRWVPVLCQLRLAL
jgi:hypothetical protein